MNEGRDGGGQGSEVGNGLIFVAIAAYRDLELLDTINGAIQNADEPEKLRFGVVHQYGPETVRILDPIRGDERLRTVEYSWRESRGVGDVRGMAEELYRGEEFVLQIDAHMAFKKGYDTRLKEEWKTCKDPKAVLSSYPGSYKVLPNGVKELHEGYVQSRVKLVPNEGFFMLTAKLVGTDEVTRVAFVSGGLEFFKGEALSKVRYIREIMFGGEEVARSIEFFTHGYNVYAPIGLPIYHNYGRPGAHRLSQDMEEAGRKEEYDARAFVGFKVFDDMLKGKDMRYFGAERSLEEFEEFAGVKLAERKVVE